MNTRQTETFLMLLQENIQTGNHYVTLTPSEKQYVDVLFKEQPQIYYKIVNAIEEVMKNNSMKNNSIHIHDIPEIILNMQKIIKLHIISNSVKNVELFNILRYIVETFLNADILPLPKLEIEVMKHVAETSFILLNTNHKVKINDDCCFFC